MISASKDFKVLNKPVATNDDMMVCPRCKGISRCRSLLAIDTIMEKRSPMTAITAVQVAPSA
nr:hypothetical protein [uncultured Duganella sp.]